MFWRTAALSFLATMSVLSQAPMAWREYAAREKVARENAAKWEVELRTKAPRIQIVLFENDQEVPTSKFTAMLFNGGNLLSPVSTESGIATYNRECEQQQLLINCKDHILYLPDLGTDLLKTGALIVVHRVTKKSLLEVERQIPTPLPFNDQYEKICLFFDSRFTLREYWLASPAIVRTDLKAITSVAVSPRTSGLVSYQMSYHFE